MTEQQFAAAVAGAAQALMQKVAWTASTAGIRPGVVEAACRQAEGMPKRKYRSTGTGGNGPFDIEVEAEAPADAFVEVALAVYGETRVDTLVDLETGQDVMDQIDPDDPVL